VSGDYLDTAPLWVSLAAQTEAFARSLTNAGAHVDTWSLPEMGIKGNSHMFMMDSNSAEIAGMVSQWIREKVAQGG
jgi:hypothetical protein